MNIADSIQTGLLSAILIYLIFQNKIILTNNKIKNGRKLVMDSCALIDGRIVEIVNAGFAPTQLIIPKFIIHELQMLADSGDAHKRDRARFGLDIVSQLQSNSNCEVVVSKVDFTNKLPIDNKLVKLAKQLSADLCTIDYNLNKVASIEGVRVLNVNELAGALRPIALPGEKKRVKIVQKGSNKDQGVGYLDDGSMVVVQGGAKYIGKIIDIEVSRYLQTEAGKMLFAQKVPTDKRNPKK